MDQILEFASNHPFLSIGTVIAGLAAIFFELRIKAGGVTAISTAKAVQLINGGAQVVDIRDKDPFDTGHIIDATNIAAADLDGATDKRLKKNKSILVVCDTGSKSSQSVARLRKAGIESAFSLQGGFSAWQTENLPVVSGSD